MSQISFLPWWAILEVADGNVWHVDTNHCPPLSGTILRPSTCLHQRVTTVLIATLFSEIELLSIIIWARSIEMCTISNCVEMLTLKGSFAWYRNKLYNHEILIVMMLFFVIWEYSRSHRLETMLKLNTWRTLFGTSVNIVLRLWRIIKPCRIIELLADVKDPLSIFEKTKSK